MNDPRIANPLIIANVLYNDQGTMRDVHVTPLDVQETFCYTTDPETGLADQFVNVPTLRDVERAYQILGAIIETDNGELKHDGGI